MATVKLGAPATCADIEGLPKHEIGEIVGGELHVSPRPAPRHALATSRLGSRLGPPFDEGIGGPGGWWLLDEPELHFASDVVVPDLAGWRRERLPALPETAYFELAPDWACEALSPSTERFDRSRKVGVYAREGVPWVWLVSPEACLLEILKLAGDRYVIFATHDGEATVCASPFEALQLRLASLWPDPGPAQKR